MDGLIEDAKTLPFIDLIEGIALWESRICLALALLAWAFTFKKASTQIVPGLIVYSSSSVSGK